MKEQVMVYIQSAYEAACHEERRRWRRIAASATNEKARNYAKRVQRSWSDKAAAVSSASIKASSVI